MRARMCASRFFRRYKSPWLVCTTQPWFSFLWQTVRTNSHRRQPRPRRTVFIWIFECSKRLHDVRLCCLCVSPVEQDGLAPSLTRAVVEMQTDSEAPEWEAREEEIRGRILLLKLYPVLIIEIVSTLWEPSSSISLSFSPFSLLVSFPPLHLLISQRRTDRLGVQAGADREAFSQTGERQGGRARGKTRRGRNERGGWGKRKIVSAHPSQCTTLLLNRFRSSLPLSPFFFPSFWSLKSQRKLARKA